MIQQAICPKARFPPEHAVKNRMERSKDDRVLLPHQSYETFLHFQCCGLGKSDHKDLFRWNASFCNKMLDTSGKHIGLATARTGQGQTGTATMTYCFLLRWTQHIDSLLLFFTFPQTLYRF